MHRSTGASNGMRSWEVCESRGRPVGSGSLSKDKTFLQAEPPPQGLPRHRVRHTGEPVTLEPKERVVQLQAVTCIAIGLPEFLPVGPQLPVPDVAISRATKEHGVADEPLGDFRRHPPRERAANRYQHLNDLPLQGQVPVGPNGVALGSPGDSLPCGSEENDAAPLENPCHLPEREVRLWNVFEDGDRP